MKDLLSGVDDIFALFSTMANGHILRCNILPLCTENSKFLIDFDPHNNSVVTKDHAFDVSTPNLICLCKNCTYIIELMFTPKEPDHVYKR